MARPYVVVRRGAWSSLADATEIDVDEATLERLRGLGDPTSQADVEEIYRPLTQLLHLYMANAGRLRDDSNEFLRLRVRPTPFVIGVAGSVAVGKSTTSRLLQELLRRAPGEPRVDLVTTDGFLFPNAELEERGLLKRKGFPESYNRKALLQFVVDVKSGVPRVETPVYSHLIYDIELGQTLVVVGMTLSIVLAAILIGPAVFAEHMRRAGHGGQQDVLDHAQEAFFSAGLQSIGVGLLVAAVGALVVTLISTRRLGRWLGALSGGAARVSAGHYEQPVVLVGSSPELERVADAFNGMALQIQTTELRRRTLLTDVAHELRTPIAAIDVTLEALEDGVLTPDAETYNTLRAQSSRLARLAADIRDVSAAEEGRQPMTPRVVTAACLVEQTFTEWSPRCEEAGVELATRVAEDSVVDVDTERIGQVMDNLMANALRHTSASGSVVIRSRMDDGLVLLEVVDDGEGIDADALAHVMERFFRGDPSRTRSAGSGTGVGLAISRAIVRAHGGDLTARSDGPGCGATFTVALPSSSNLHRI